LVDKKSKFDYLACIVLLNRYIISCFLRKIVDFTEFGSNLSSTIDRVNENYQPIITRQRQKPAVLISLDDYNFFKK